MISPRELPTRETALPDRPDPVQTDELHYVSGQPLDGPFPANAQTAMFAMGCFWGAERLFSEISRCIRHGGGIRRWLHRQSHLQGCVQWPNGPCRGRPDSVQPRPDFLRGFAQVVLGEPRIHEGMQQGVDVGTQYRSAVYWFDEAQRGAAKTSLKDYETALRDRGFGRITTEIAPAPPLPFRRGLPPEPTWPRPRPAVRA